MNEHLGHTSTTSLAHPVNNSSKTSLKELAVLFLRLGTTSFGGPAVHIAMMEEEVVRRRGWLTHDEFLDLLGATNMIPGPNSTEMAIHIGYKMAGWLGLLVAGISFIMPAVLIVLFLAWVYVSFGDLPSLEGMLYGIKPAVIAVVVQALLKLARSCIKSWQLALMAIASIALTAMGVHELVVLCSSGAAMALVRSLTKRSNRPTMAICFSPILPLANSGAAVALTTKGVLPVFLFFLKIGSVLFGSGYVLLAFLRADLVERYGWLTEQELLDAVAVGQVTPGPLFTTATFIGYLLGGPVGAAAATLGIFLPAFVFVAISAPLVPWLRKSAVASGFLDGVNVASLALMAVVTWQLGWSAIVDIPTILLALGSVYLLFRRRVNSVWVVLGGAMIGLTVGLLR